jgi:hypothetical protein
MRVHSEATRKKISASLRKHYADKREGSTPEQRRRAQLADKFGEGHPNNMKPNVVRNYGDLGKDVKVVVLEIPDREDLISND